MSNSDRAVQFAPFASLRGYYNLIREEEKITQSRRELSDEECAALSEKLLGIKKGDIISVTYYDGDCYRTVSGICRGMDIPMHILTVSGKRICTDDICRIETDV